MGAIISRFKKEKTTFEILEKLEENIKTIEEYTISTQRRQKRIVGNFLVISVGLYVILALVFYFAFFPPTWIERVTYTTPLLLFPLIIIMLKKVVAWYFQRKVNSNSDKLSTLKNEKKKILEKVMDKETYKVALELLNRFGDKPGTYRAQSQTPTAPPPRPSTALVSATPPQIIPRQQLFVNNNTPGTTPSHWSNRSDPPRALQQIPIPSPRLPVRAYNSPQKPFPIIDLNDKGVLEKMVDYFIGDGPNNRFAMICKECHRHNGMSLEEEFYYSSFICAFCSFLNQARKLRPTAPKLISQSASATNSGAEQTNNSSTSTSEKDSSDSGSEVEVDKREKNTETQMNTIINNDNIIDQIVTETETINNETITDANISIDQNAEEDKSDTDKKND